MAVDLEWEYKFEDTMTGNIESGTLLFDYENGNVFNVRAKSKTDDYIVKHFGADNIADEISDEINQ